MSDARSFSALTRTLLFFHKHVEPSDRERRHRLLKMLFDTAGSANPATKACVQLCSNIDGAASWQHQSRCSLGAVSRPLVCVLPAPRKPSSHLLQPIPSPPRSLKVDPDTPVSHPTSPLIPSHPIPSHPFPSHPTPPHPAPSHPVPSHPVLSHPIPSHPIPSQEVGPALATLLD